MEVIWGCIRSTGIDLVKVEFSHNDRKRQLIGHKMTWWIDVYSVVCNENCILFYGVWWVNGIEWSMNVRGACL